MVNRIIFTILFLFGCVFASKFGTMIVVDSSGNYAEIFEGSIQTVTKGEVDTGNSTSTPLGADSVFTGVAHNILNHEIIFVNVYSNVGSATDGLSIQQSPDSVNWWHTDEYTIEAGAAKNFSINSYAKYCRIVYTNGGTAQDTFALQTIFKGNSKPSSHRIQDSIIDDDDAELVKAVLTGKTAQGDFINFSSTNNGNFKVSLEEIEDGLGANNKTQLKITPYDSLGNKMWDGVTSSLMTIDYDHHEIHSGSHYFISNYDSLASGDTVSFGVFTRDTSRIAHLVFILQSTAATRFFIYEGSTFDTATGTATTPINNNRNSANTSSKLFRKNPTFSAAGTLLSRAGFGVGTTPATSNSGMVGRSNEINLKQNTYYRFRIQSLAANNIVSYTAEWYEHISLE